MTKKIPKVKKLSKDKIIEALQNQLKQKDKELSELRRENEILFKLSLKNAKEKLEGLDKNKVVKK